MEKDEGNNCISINICGFSRWRQTQETWVQSRDLEEPLEESYVPLFVMGKREKRTRPISRGGANIPCFSKSSGYAAFFFFFGNATWQTVSQLPDKGWNPCSLQCKHQVLTTGLPGNTQCHFAFEKICISTCFS